MFGAANTSVMTMAFSRVHALCQKQADSNKYFKECLSQLDGNSHPAELGKDVMILVGNTTFFVTQQNNRTQCSNDRASK